LVRSLPPAQWPGGGTVNAIGGGTVQHSRTVLTSSRQRPWQNFTATFVRANKAAGIANLHFHDLRGTAATRFYIAGLKVRTIGEILGWAEDDVEKIIRNQAAQ
jgi:integrase